MTDPVPSSSSPAPPRTHAIRSQQAVWVFLSIAGAAFVALLSSVLIARALDVDERGVYARFLVFSTTAGIVLELGGEFTLIRAYASLDGRVPPFVYSYARWACWAVPLAAAAPIALTALGGDSSVGSTFVWLCSGLAVGGSLLNRITTAHLVARGRFRWLVVVRTTSASGPFLGLVAVAGTHHPLTGETLAGGALAGQFLIALGTLVFVVGREFSSRALIAAGSGWTVFRKDNLRLHLANIGTFLLSRADQVALGLTGHVSALGLYAVAVNYSETVGYAPLSLAPLIARRQGAQLKGRRLLLVCGGTVLVACLIAAGAPFLITALYGDRYTQALPVALVLLPGAAMYAIARVIQFDILRFEEKRRLVAIVTGGTALLEFLLVLTATTATQAAICALVSYALFTVCMLVMRSRLKILRAESRS